MKHHIYTPHWPHETVNPDRCREAVPEGGRGVGFYQCARAPKVFEIIDGEEYGFCKQHSRAEQERRKAKRRARYETEAEAERRKFERRRLELKAFLEISAMDVTTAAAAGIKPLWEQIQQWTK